MTISTTHIIYDPDDDLSDDAGTLRSMYAEFVQEDRQLAGTGL